MQTDTLMSCSGSSTSSEIPADEQRDIGISPGLLRLSVGYTGSLESRITQIERALNAPHSPSPAFAVGGRRSLRHAGSSPGTSSSRFTRSGLGEEDHLEVGHAAQAGLDERSRSTTT